MASPSEVATEERTASAAGKTDVGRRRDHNEDQILVSPELGLYAVADGMGGHSAGDVASSIAAAALEEFFWEEQDLGDDIEGLDDISEGAARLVKAVHHCNREVFSRSGRSANQGGMGSTVVAVQVDEDEGVIHIVHVGDSRCYRIRHGEIEQMTKDHSMINEALRLNPDLSEEILKQLPSNVVTRALGTKENVQPDVSSEPLCKGDIYLLCSDGLSGEVADEDLLFGVLESEELGDGCELLVAMANEAGGRDNISAVLVRIEKGATPPPPGVKPKPKPKPKKDEEAEVEVDVSGDDQLSDADLDAWLAEPSDPGEDGEDVLFSEPPGPSAVQEEDDLDDELDELYGGSLRPGDEEAEIGIEEVHEELHGELELDEEDLDEDEGESLSALAPPFGNEPPRLRRPESVAPEASEDDEDDEVPSIAPLPVMGIGEMEDTPLESESVRRCHHCGHKLLPEERFCGMCGGRTVEEDEEPDGPVCDACGTVVVEDTRFCVECGVRL